MGFELLHAGEPGHGVRIGGGEGGAGGDDAGAFAEGLYGKGRGEAGRAERGQHMVGPGEVVAEGLRRVGAEEDRARMTDTGQHGPRLAHQHFEVLRGHAVGEGAKNKVGPVLNGVIGRTAGTLPGFTYSDAMIAAGQSGVVWTDEELNIYLTNPKELVPGTKMSFAGLKKPEDRAALLAWLRTQADTPAALPSDADIATARIQPSPRCCCTSSTSLVFTPFRS